MKLIFSLMLLVFCSMMPAQAIEVVEYEYAPQTMTEKDMTTRKYPVLILEAPESKPKFKDKHPRVYKVYRGARKCCIVAKPFVEVGGAVAQMVSVFF